MTITPTAGNDPALLRLAAGRVVASKTQPYLSTALFALHPVRTPGLGTFGVDDKWRMYWDPDKCLEWSVDEVAATLLHEVGHLLRDHSPRFKAIGDPVSLARQWNLAGDIAINEDLRSSGIAMPGDWRFFEEVPGAVAGLSAEQYYALLRKNADENEKNRKPRLHLLPGDLPVHHPVPQHVLAGSTVAMFAAGTSVTLADEHGAVVPGALGPATVRSAQALSFDLLVPLAPGKYTVRAECAGAAVEGDLRVSPPSIRISPSRLAHGYYAPAKITVGGKHTAFDDQTSVTLLDDQDQPVPGAIGTVEVGSANLLGFALPTVADGNYTISVTQSDGAVLTAPLPVGQPFIRITPARLPSGHVAPQRIRISGEDIVFDATTSAYLLSDQGTPIAGALTRPVTTGPASLSVDLTQSLDDGVYLVEVTTSTDRATAQLVVGDSDDSDGSGDGQGQGQSEGQGEGQGQGSGSGQALPDCGSGTDGIRRPYELAGDDNSLDDDQIAGIKHQTAVQIQQHSKSRGTVPAGWERWAEEVLDPKVDWRTELRSKVRRAAATVTGLRDYTYSRPSRRGTPGGIVLPAMRQPPPPDVAFVVDTSGSVSDAMISDLKGEIKGVLKAVGIGGKRLHVLSVDAKVHTKQSVGNVGQIRLGGGGGTDMRVGIEAATQMKPRPAIVIVGTDGYTPWPDTQPPGITLIALLVGDDPPETPGWIRRVVVTD